MAAIPGSFLPVAFSIVIGWCLSSWVMWWFSLVSWAVIGHTCQLVPFQTVICVSLCLCLAHSFPPKQPDDLVYLVRWWMCSCWWLEASWSQYPFWLCLHLKLPIFQSWGGKWSWHSQYFSVSGCSREHPGCVSHWLGHSVAGDWHLFDFVDGDCLLGDVFCSFINSFVNICAFSLEVWLLLVPSGQVLLGWILVSWLWWSSWLLPHLPSKCPSHLASSFLIVQVGRSIWYLMILMLDILDCCLHDLDLFHLDLPFSLIFYSLMGWLNYLPGS